MAKYHIKTWGCQMNYSDAERFKFLFESNGYKETTSPDEANIIIFFTCSVRQNAEDKFLGMYRQIKRLKARNPNLKIIMTGCMVQRFDRSTDSLNSTYLEKLKKMLSWVDSFIPVGGVHELAEYLNLNVDSELNIDSYMDLKSSYSSTVEAYIPISTGCNNFCTYCIVPYTRGKEVSRSYDSILSECKRLVSNEYKMINLLGQNVNSWNGDINESDINFPKLLNDISNIDGEFWVTFLTSHPKDFGEDLVKVIADNENVPKYLHLPIQSGSDVILERMNRKYTRLEYLNKVQLIKKSIPNIRLSTDIIVGFPGETEEDFNLTKELFKYEIFEMAYISEYSPRKGTPSYSLEDDVSAEVKTNRKKILSDLVKSNATKVNSKLLGKDMRVLILNERGLAKTNRLVDVNVKLDTPMRVGKFVEVKIIDTSAGGLQAQIVV